MVIDIHSHILPEVDDGAKNVEESLNLLEISYNQGIKTIVATPHFYANEDNIEKYKDNISAAYKKVLDAAKGVEIPEIYIGSEVYYFKNIGKSRGVKQLTLGNSNFLLLELPLYNIDKQVLKDISDLKQKLEITPIIAHIERYSKFRGYRELLKLVSSGVCLAQINATAVLFNDHKKTAFKLLKKGYVSFVASDTHSTEYRPPLIEKAMKEIRLLCDRNVIRKIEHASEYICSKISGNRYIE